MNVTINRRNFLKVSSATPLILVGGCIPLFGLLRFGMRGGLIRAGARAARLSRRGTHASFGRIGATTLQLMRLYRGTQAIKNIEGNVFGIESEEEAINVKANDKLSECFVDGVPIITTRVEGDWYEHQSNAQGINESIGTSRRTSDSAIEHYDNESNFVGADMLEETVIRHIGKDRKLVGTTQLRIVDSSTLLVEDDTYLRSLYNKLAANYREEFGQNTQGEKLMQAVQSECLTRPSSENCDELVVQAQNALSQLEEKFSRY